MPFPLEVAVPLAGWAVMGTLAGLMLPSGSVSLPATSKVAGVSSGVVAVSTLATGGSGRSATETVTLALAHRLLVSQIW